MFSLVIDDGVLREMAREIAAVDGIRAVALGGSRARGTQRVDSDYDLGLSYDDTLDHAALSQLASRWSDTEVELARPGGWGPWVDAGAWLSVRGAAVDWILRDVARVQEQCDRAVRGEFAFHPQPGHPLGFLDVAYAAEVATCVPLVDDDGLLGDLKARLVPYPAPLRDSMIAALWQVDFLLDAAVKGAKTADASYVALCASTASMLVAHAWHAAAGAWVVNEKGLVPGVERLPLDSGGFATHVAEALATLGTTEVQLRRAIDAVRDAPRPNA